MGDVLNIFYYMILLGAVAAVLLLAAAIGLFLHLRQGEERAAAKLGRWRKSLREKPERKRRSVLRAFIDELIEAVAPRKAGRKPKYETQRSAHMERYLSRLKERDPQFAADRFLLRSREVFFKVNREDKGWQAFQPLMSDGMAERFLVREALRGAKGLRRVRRAAQIDASNIVQVESDRLFDTVHIRYQGSVEELEARGEGIGPHTVPIDEVWTFLRKPGARTGKRGLMEGVCPSCGTPVTLQDAGRCDSCESWLRTGRHDWVLSKITQGAFWKPRHLRDSLRRLAFFAEADPGMNVHFLEDRVSVAFWQWQRALWKRDPAPLMKLATTELCAHFGRAVGLMRRFYKEVQLDGVEIEEFTTKKPWDHLRIRVEWSALAGGDEDRLRWDLKQVRRADYFYLARRAGLKTDERRGLCSLRCWSCGAPMSERTGVRCEYCGGILNDGAHDWILTSVRAGKRINAGARHLTS